MRLVIYSLNFKTSYIFYACMGYEIMRKHKQYKVCKYDFDLNFQ